MDKASYNLKIKPSPTNITLTFNIHTSANGHAFEQIVQMDECLLCPGVLAPS